MGKKKRVCEACGLRERFSNGFFANFPLDENRCREWVRLCGKEDLAFLPIEKLHEVRYVCGIHFEKWDFNRKGNRLKKNAIPTLKLIAAPLADHILKEFPLHVASKQTTVPPSLTTSHLQGLPSISSILDGTLEKISKINEDHCYDNGKVHVDHSYSLQNRPFYHTDTELVAELSDYIEKLNADQTNKVSEGQENSNTTTLIDGIAENEDGSQVLSKIQEVQTCRKNSAAKSDSNSFSTGVDSEKQDESQISSKSRINTDRNNSKSNSHERKSAADGYTYSYNLTSDNVIDVIRNESAITAAEDITASEDITSPEDLTVPEAQTCVTDAKEYRFDGDYFDDGLPTVKEPEPEVPEIPEALFSWQNELNLFPLDDFVTLEDDELHPRGGARRPALAADAPPYRRGAPEAAPDAEYQCNECQKEITGFRYTCVQCADWDLCGACEARGEHAEHYLLRIPSPRPYNEIQTVLAAIRQQLLSENLFLRQEFADIDWPTEVKEEMDLGGDSGGEHTCSEGSSDESAAPRAPAAAARPRDALLHISAENDQTFSAERRVANLPASVPAASHEIPQDLITSILTSRNHPEVRTHSRKTLGRNSLLKPIHNERVPEDPLRTDGIELASYSPKAVAGNLTQKSPANRQCDDLPTIIIEDDAVQNPVTQQATIPVNVLFRTKAVKTIPHDLPVSARPAGSVQNSVPQPIQQPTLPVNILRKQAVKMIHRDLPVSARPVDSHRISRAQFFDKGFDDNVPAIILEDDEEDQPTDKLPHISLQETKYPLTKPSAHNSPSRMDTDSSPTVQRVTRTKRKLEQVTDHDSPVRKSKNIQKDESLLQTIGGAIQTLDQLIHQGDIVDITEDAPDTSRLTGGSETVVLRVPPGSNEAALLQALQSKSVVLLEPLQNVIQRVTPPRRKRK